MRVVIAFSVRKWHEKKSGLVRVCFVLLALLTCHIWTSAQVTADEYVPNDPKLDLAHVRTLNLLKAYARILEIEQTSQPKMQQAVIAMLDEWVDCSHPELSAKCSANLAFNATDQPYQNTNIHGMTSAGTGIAATDNNMGVASIGGFLNRIKFFPIKVCDGNLCKPEWVQAGLAKVLEYKKTGVPIVVVGCNFASGVTDPTGMDKLLKDLNAEGIYLIAGGPNNDPPQNMDEANVFPVTYGARHSNIISVTAGDASGERLLPSSAFGPRTINLIAPGESVRTISILDPINGSASISGTSAVTQQVAAAYALVRVYRESDPTRAASILKFTARMFPELEQKLNAASGSTDDAGRMAGRIDVYDALSLPFGCPAPTSELMWVTKRDSNRLVALDSLFLTQGPFAVQNAYNLLTVDRRTRIMVFAYNVSLMPTQPISSVVIEARDSAGHTVLLPVEFESKVSSLPCVSQLNVNLTPASPEPQLAPGDVSLRLLLNGKSSSSGMITIKPQV